METTNKTTDLSQAEAKIMFKKYATAIVKELRLKGVRMIKKNRYANGVNCFHWEGCATKKSCAQIYIGIAQEKSNPDYISYIVFTIRINYQDYFVIRHHTDETDLEKIVRIKTENMADERYPLSNIRIVVTVENPKKPKLNPGKMVARQLYLALKCRNKLNSPETISKIKKTEEQIDKFAENEADKIVKSFFK